jgi:hypothetical protein
VTLLIERSTTVFVDPKMDKFVYTGAGLEALSWASCQRLRTSETKET